jgi:hypothetical protein
VGILAPQVVPTCFQALLCDRSWSTDDLKAESSQLVLRSRFKTAWIVAVKTLQYLQELTRIQRDPHSKIKQAQSRRRSYPHHQAIKDHEKEWHAPTHEEWKSPQLLAHLADVTRRATRDTVNRSGTRAMHKQKATHTAVGVAGG